MQSRPAAGEVGLAAIFAITGLVWIAGAVRLPFWEGFAPNLGFLPLIYGILLAALAAITVAMLFRGDAAPNAGSIGKPLLVLAVIAVTVIGLSVAGFSASIFLLLLFLYAVVEKLSVIRSISAAAGITLILYLVFKTWLGVPLPKGPWGI